MDLKAEQEAGVDAETAEIHFFIIEIDLPVIINFRAVHFQNAILGFREERGRIAEAELHTGHGIEADFIIQIDASASGMMAYPMPPPP